ncbi:MAG: radical SAM protein [Nitrospirae bacterium]|nr:radical SAM protein [Nitrospirota bacterium]
MRVLLVVPPSSLEERWGKFDKAVQTYLPLGLAYIASIIEKEGHEVKAIDAVASKYSFGDIEEIIKIYSPDILGQQTVFSNLNDCYQTAKIAKNIKPDIKTVLGGAHTTMYPEESIKKDFIDFIVIGEGEFIVKKLLDCLENRGDLAAVPGIVWKTGDKIIRNEPPSPIKDLDSLPLPARHLFPIEKYSAASQLKGKRVMNMVVSRGCPFRCSFCWVPEAFGRNIRYRSPESVVREMKLLKEKYGADCIRFWDDSFSANRKWINQFCDLLITEDLNIPWSCFTRVDLVNLAVLKKMEASGCYQIFYGIESGVQRLLDIINKGTTLEQASNAVKLTKAAGIESFCSYMLALPGETQKDAEQTIEFAKKLNSDYVQFNLTIPHMAGEKFCDFAKEHGTVLEDVNTATLFENPAYIPFGRTKEELKDTVKKAYKSYYLRPSYIIKRVYKIKDTPLRKVVVLFWTGLKVLLWR